VREQGFRALKVLLAIPLMLFLGACQNPSPHWEHVDEGIPHQVGITSIAIVPSNPQLLYVASYTLGGLYRSDDSGDSWRLINKGLEQTTVYTVAVHPKDWNVAVVGTADGGYVTLDGGDSWKELDGLPDTFVYAVAFIRSGKGVYVGMEGNGVYFCEFSERGGRCQEDGLGGETVLALAVGLDRKVYAGTAGRGVWVREAAGWHQAKELLSDGFVAGLETTPDGRVYALSDGKLYVSDATGSSWRLLSPEGVNSLSFAIHPHSSDEIYLGTKGMGILVSWDGGKSWEAMAKGLRKADITCVAVSPVGDVVYVGTLWGGVYKVISGKVCRPARGRVGKRVVMALAHDPHDPGILYGGTLDGVYKSEDGGERWELISSEVGRIYVNAIALIPRCPRFQENTANTWIYVGAHDGVYISTDGGESWRWATEGLGPVTVFNITAYPEDPCIVYAGSWGNNILFTSDGGQTWAPIHHGLETLSVHSFAIDPRSSKTLYAGTVEGIYKSADGGKSWRPVGRGMREKITVFSLLITPGGSIYAGTTDGVYQSEDGGETWHFSGLGGVTITVLALGPLDERVIYAGTEHHGLYRSTDRGRRWELWGRELHTMSVYAILAEDDAIWLGTDEGIMKTVRP